MAGEGRIVEVGEVHSNSRTLTAPRKESEHFSLLFPTSSLARHRCVRLPQSLCVRAWVPVTVCIFAKV